MARETTPKPSKVYFVERRPDTGAYIHKCDNGHTFAEVLNNPLHEVLFESGVSALLFGFNREALASFHVALERYYEFATKAMLFHLGIMDRKETEAMWKHACLSEREFGAFVATHLIAFKRSFAYKSEIQELTTRRNKVIHAGAIPLETDVMKHGETVFRIVRGTTRELIELNYEVTNFLLQNEGGLGSYEAIEKVTGAPHASSQWKMMALSSPVGRPETTLAEYVEVKRKMVHAYGEVPSIARAPAK